MGFTYVNLSQNVLNKVRLNSVTVHRTEEIRLDDDVMLKLGHKLLEDLRGTKHCSAAFERLSLPVRPSDYFIDGALVRLSIRVHAAQDVEVQGGSRRGPVILATGDLCAFETI
jgi:hypothetical protein